MFSSPNDISSKTPFSMMGMRKRGEYSFWLCLARIRYIKIIQKIRQKKQNKTKTEVKFCSFLFFFSSLLNKTWSRPICLIWKCSFCCYFFFFYFFFFLFSRGVTKIKKKTQRKMKNILFFYFFIAMSWNLLENFFFFFFFFFYYFFFIFWKNQKL